jgi:hypothetical protein
MAYLELGIFMAELLQSEWGTYQSALLTSHVKEVEIWGVCRKKLNHICLL